MTEHKRITGRELIHKILDHPAWLDLPVHVLVMDDGDDGGFLNTVEADRFELDGPDVLSLISEKPAVGHEPVREAPRCTITVDGNRCDKPADHIEHVCTPPAAAPAEPGEDTVPCGRDDEDCSLRGGSAHCGGCRG